MYGEQYVRDLAAHDGSIGGLEQGIKMAKDAVGTNGLGLVAKADVALDANQADGKKELKFGDDVIARNDIGSYASEFGSKYHGAESALPSTGIKLHNYADGVGKLINDKADEKVKGVEEFNKSAKAAKAALDKIGSKIPLTLINTQAVAAKAEDMKKSGDQIVGELSKIETYTDIITMRNFVRRVEGQKGAMELMIGVLLILGLIHGTVTGLELMKTRHRLKKSIKELRAMGPEQDKWVNDLVDASLPALLATNAGRIALQSLGLTDEEISAYMVRAMEEGSSTLESANIISTLKINMRQMIATSKDFLTTIDNDTRTEINGNVGVSPLGAEAKSFYVDHMKGKDVSPEFMSAFIMTLYERSPVFRKKFLDYDGNVTAGK